MSNLYCLLALGVLSMLILALARRQKYCFSVMTVLLITLTLAVSGILGIKILFYVETGRWVGMSFYGAMFLVPLIMIIISVLLKEPYGKILDFSASEGCIMLCVMKINCYIVGCCSGIDLFKSSAGKYIKFPSQIVEAIVSFLIMLILLYLENKKQYKGKIYAMFLLLYGGTRFILNFFRFGLNPFIWILPAGHFWSLVAIIIGIMWLILVSYKNKRRYYGN